MRFRDFLFTLSILGCGCTPHVEEGDTSEDGTSVGGRPVMAESVSPDGTLAGAEALDLPMTAASKMPDDQPFVAGSESIHPTGGDRHPEHGSNTDLPIEQGALVMIGTWVIEDQIPMGANDGTIEAQKVITAERWDQLSIILYDNQAGFAVLQSGDNDPFYPGLFNRVDWILDGTSRAHVCQFEQGLPSAQAALELSTDEARTDLEAGCRGFPWKTMVRIES